MRHQDMAVRVYIHGLESSSRGTKGAFFRERFPDMIVGDFTGPFTQRMDRLQELLAGRDGLMIVGSSYGGLMATVFALQYAESVRKLVLLAPALQHLPSAQQGGGTVECPVILYHGSRDEVVPPGPVRRIAEGLFPNLTYRLTDDDHFLHRTFFAIDWDELLS